SSTSSTTYRTSSTRIAASIFGIPHRTRRRCSGRAVITRVSAKNAGATMEDSRCRPTAATVNAASTTAALTRLGRLTGTGGAAGGVALSVRFFRMVAQSATRIRSGPKCFHATVRQRTGALVARIAGVALHPHPLHLVPGDLLVQGPPQVLVLHRLLRRSAPAVAFPAGQPGL